MNVLGLIGAIGLSMATAINHAPKRVNFHQSYDESLDSYSIVIDDCVMSGNTLTAQGLLNYWNSSNRYFARTSVYGANHDDDDTYFHVDLRTPTSLMNSAISIGEVYNLASDYEFLYVSYLGMSKSTTALSDIRWYFTQWFFYQDFNIASSKSVYLLSTNVDESTFIESLVPTKYVELIHYNGESQFYFDFSFELASDDFFFEIMLDNMFTYSDLNYWAINEEYGGSASYTYDWSYGTYMTDLVTYNTDNFNLLLSAINNPYSVSLTSYPYGITTASTAFDNGYNQGHEEGYEEGHAVGFSEGVESANDYTFWSLFGAIADTPVLIIRNLFNFDLFGVNLMTVVLSLFTGLIIFYLLRKLL